LAFSTYFREESFLNNYLSQSIVDDF